MKKTVRPVTAPGEPGQRQAKHRRHSPRRQLQLIAAAAHGVVGKIRLYFPVKGRRWNFENGSTIINLIPEVCRGLEEFERLINPDRRSFDDYCRRNLDQIAGFQVVYRAVLGAALEVVIKRYNAILKHYGIEDIICEDSDPGLFTWHKVPPIRSRLLEDLELAAGTLDSTIEVCSDFLDEFDQAKAKVKPKWNEETGELRYGKTLCVRLKAAAPKQRAVFQAFENSHWRHCIEIHPDDLPDYKIAETLRDCTKR